MEHSPLLELHRAAGARLRADPPLLLTYGDVPAEYAAALEGCALFDLCDRGRIDVHGVDAANFLHRLLSSDVCGLPAGRGQQSLLLSAKGKVLCEMELLRDADGFRLSVAPGAAPALLAALDRYLFAEKVELKDASAAHAPLALCGPRLPEIVAAVAGCALPEGERSSAQARFEDAPLAIVRLPVAGSPGVWLDAGGERAPALWRALCAVGARPAGRVAWDSLRVEAGWAESGSDIDEHVYPQEARLERAFDLEKGCYVGQEVVAKIDTYGGLNKRLAALSVAHDDPVARGTRLLREDEGEWRDLGVVTSWAYSFQRDGGLVLAYVKRRHQATGTRFRLGDGPASAEIVPLPQRPGALPPTGGFE